MASNWNIMIERILAADLTLHETRLALAVARSTLGYRTASEAIGERLLQERSGLTDRRSFERARTGLVEKGLLTYTAGRRGRGNRAVYGLLLHQPSDDVKARPSARISETPSTEVKARVSTPKKRAVERARIGRKEKTSAGVDANDLRRKAFEAYIAAGGRLDLTRERNTLAKRVTELHQAYDEKTILAACTQLGRDREFPGFLKRACEDIANNGGPCTNEGADRFRLTRLQLKACTCAICTTWADKLEARNVQSVSAAA
jgi:hypothetical protein